MKKFEQKMKKIIAGAVIASMVLFYSLPAFAAGNIGPTGPQVPTGNIAPTGPQTATGALEPTGPQAATGAVEQSTSTAPVANLTNSEVNQSNYSTGPDSENQNTTNLDSESNINIENDANVDNDLNADLVTGQNNIGSNTMAGNVKTGEINGNVNVINALNSALGPDDTVGSQSINTSGMNGITLMPSDNRVNLQNAQTGANSENSNLVNDGQVINVLEVNDATANNNIDINADSGTNDISNNTKVGNLDTGDICIAANLINLLNIAPEIALSIDFWNLLGGFAGDITIDAANDTTGANSENTNSVDLDNSANVQITNNSTTDNNVGIDTNTGNNEVGSNTVVGDIVTGATAVKNTIVNVANIVAIPIFYIVNVFGEWTGGSLLGVDPSQVFVNEINDTTGYNSENTNDTDISNELNVTMENNADINNNLNIYANTGNNKIHNNTIAGDLRTGDIKVASNVINISNLIGKGAKEFALRIINIFGDWGDGKGGCIDNQCDKDEDEDEGDGMGGGGETPPVVTPPPVVVTPPSIIRSTGRAVLASTSQTLPVTGGNGVVDRTNALVKSAQTQNNSPMSYLYWILVMGGILSAWGTVEYLAYKKTRS